MRERPCACRWRHSKQRSFRRRGDSVYAGFGEIRPEYELVALVDDVVEGGRLVGDEHHREDFVDQELRVVMSDNVRNLPGERRVGLVRQEIALAADLFMRVSKEMRLGRVELERLDELLPKYPQKRPAGLLVLSTSPLD